jgi:hypothetical protein
MAVVSVETRKVFDGLGLTRREERVLRHATGLIYAEPRGRLERIFYAPLRLSLDMLVALIIIAIFVVVTFWATWRFGDFFKGISLPLIVVTFFIGLNTRDRLIKKLYRALIDRTTRLTSEGSVGE